MNPVQVRYWLVQEPRRSGDFLCNRDAIQAPVLLGSNHHEYEKLRKHII